MNYLHMYFITGLLLSISPLVVATPIMFGSNYYEYVEVADPYVGDNNSWATASASASTSIYNGISGHLATITSQGENDFLMSLVTTNYSTVAGAWLGGKAPEGWIVGPEAGQSFSYTNWGGIEPNNEGYAYMNVGTLYAGVGPGDWADDSGIQGFPEYPLDQVIGYFVEYEGPISVPEPSIILLLGIGMAGLMVSQMKRQA